MVTPKFSLAKPDNEMRELVAKTDKKILAVWAIDCAERVMHFWEEKYPEDKRPRQAIETLQEWMKTGVFKMSVIRGASLASRAAAKVAEEGSPAQSVAHAAGQAVATAHVLTHAYGPAIYVQQAIFRASKPEEANEAVKKERDWQYKRLVELREKSLQ